MNWTAIDKEYSMVCDSPCYWGAGCGELCSVIWTGECHRREGDFLPLGCII